MSSNNKRGVCISTAISSIDHVISVYVLFFFSINLITEHETLCCHLFLKLRIDHLQLKRRFLLNKQRIKTVCILEYSSDGISGMELHRPLVSQEGNEVVRHVFQLVLTINPWEKYKNAIFSTQFKLVSHLSQGAQTAFVQGKSQKCPFIEVLSILKLSSVCY